MIALINDILDMSRIEVGKVELEQGVFSLRALGNRLYDMFAKNLDSRGIRYEVNFEGVTVDYVCGDELRISQVIINFLSNAVKFTSEGEIIVTFRQMMLQNGVDVKAVQEVLGHEHLNTTEIYTHIDNDALRVAAKANPLSHVKMKKNED